MGAHVYLAIYAVYEPTQKSSTFEEILKLTKLFINMPFKIYEKWIHAIFYLPTILKNINT